MSKHDPKTLAAFMDGETRQVWARVRATGEAIYLEDGTAEQVRLEAKARWACIVPSCYSRITTRGGARRHCFVHDGGAGHGEGGAAESLNHLAAKAMLANWAVTKAPDAEVVEEVTMKDTGSGFHRRPDVLITWRRAGAPATLALEVEYKRFTYDPWKSKQDELELQGVACTWVLGHTRFKPYLGNGSWDGRVKVPNQARILAGAGDHVLVVNPVTRQIGTLAADESMTRRISAKQTNAWLALDDLAACDLTPDGIITPAMQQIDAAEAERRAQRDARLQQHRAREEERLDKVRREAERRKRLEAEADARRERERALHTAWEEQRAAWMASPLRQTFLTRYGAIPRVIDHYGEKPGGILANPVHWHAVLYEALVHTPGRMSEFSAGDCWRVLHAAGIRLHKYEPARTAALANFLTALEREGLLEATDAGGWKVRMRYATKEEKRLRDQRRRDQELEQQQARERADADAREAANRDAEPATTTGSDMAAHREPTTVPPTSPVPPPVAAQLTMTPSRPPVQQAGRASRRGFLNRLFGR